MSTSISNILEYWRAVELFSPQSLAKVNPNDRSEPVFALDQSLPLPWEASHPFKSIWAPAKTSRRFLACCGVLELAQMRSVLEEKLGKDPEAFDERTDGQTCLFAFSVSDDGRPLFDTFVLSSCAWALSRTLKPGPESKEWLTGFEKYAKELAQDFSNRYAVLSDDARGQELTGMGFKIERIIQGKDLLSETQYVAQKLGLGHLLPKNEVRIKSGLVASARKYSAEESDFINSFYLKDLAKVAAASQNDGVGTALKFFLKESPDTETRIDVTKSIETQFRQLSPALFPRGRWPSNEHHPLVFSQQFAINTAVQELGNAKGIFAINGPPGTGKTTLLRDLISSIIVERAQRLSELSHPDAAFNGEGRWKVDKFNRVVALWKDQFKGFEIVIASNNNGAVENVSFEIPSRDAVDESWLKDSDYFADFGTRLLDRPAWAMLAARLGNKANRGDFANKFWYGAKDGKRLSANDISGDGFLNWLKSLEGQQFDWKKATEKYKAAVAHEQKLRTAHINIFNVYASLIALSREIPTVEKLIVALEKNHAHRRSRPSCSTNCCRCAMASSPGHGGRRSAAAGTGSHIALHRPTSTSPTFPGFRNLATRSHICAAAR